jgi:hypothetical protein
MVVALRGLVVAFLHFLLLHLLAVVRVVTLEMALLAVQVVVAEQIIVQQEKKLVAQEILLLLLQAKEVMVV